MDWGLVCVCIGVVCVCVCCGSICVSLCVSLVQVCWVRRLLWFGVLYIMCYVCVHSVGVDIVSLSIITYYLLFTCRSATHIQRFIGAPSLQYTFAT